MDQEAFLNRRIREGAEQKRIMPASGSRHKMGISSGELGRGKKADDQGKRLNLNPHACNNPHACLPPGIL